MPNVSLFSILKFIFICFLVYKLCTAFSLKVCTKCKGKNIKIKSLATPYNHSLNSSTTVTPPKIKMHVNRWALPCAQKVKSLILYETSLVVSRSQACSEDCLTSAGQNSFSGPRPATPHLMSAFEFCGGEHMLWIK